ncbi:nucleotidyl transferase AbiEii/AbiGii toxin family protein, partial [Candidatus Peregrinibacteria bacterium]|nr:nucleotidyl transferase AbiEii/AbiGii toxin family protein [Candidatus Peregrinibacteria bacterium]
MLIPNKGYVLHKAWLLRLLTAICEDPKLSLRLAFKGGTCAAMRGFLNRFSIDLDFDFLASEKEMPDVQYALEAIFERLGLKIKDKSAKAPQYFLRYSNADAHRQNTIKLATSLPVPKSNTYEMVRLAEIDRVVKC